MAKTAYFQDAAFQRHTMGPLHPESPMRLEAISKRLELSGILKDLRQVKAVEANAHQLELAHSIHHIQYLRDVSPASGEFPIDGDTTMMPHTLEAALLAAGSATQAVDCVFGKGASWGDRGIKRAFCAVRPPGHHAEREQAMGFCYFNNVAIAALHALETCKIKRVAILDFDVHNGNGTIDIFKDDPRVMVCSSFEHPLYPYKYVSVNRDNIICTPLEAHTTSRMFRRAVERSWLHRLQTFKPELIIISAGFDAHTLDPLASLNLETDDYRWVTDMIVDVARVYSEGRIVSCLEGGYHLEALAASVEAHLTALMQ
ncbi:histone deacetylase family protein [Allohahella marinimesophila]|uniref:Histone deacetylase family protein n=1 Tax=Allohahella marinimesophila TaxID=1054972 RepID=A0ABP7NTW5_9GAMM